MRNSDDFSIFCALLHAAWYRQVGAAGIAGGLWRCSVTAYWPRLDRALSDELGEPVPKADADAPVSAVLDALQLCGAIDNDSRIAEVHATRHHDPHHPRIVVTLERIDDR